MLAGAAVDAAAVLLDAADALNVPAAAVEADGSARRLLGPSVHPAATDTVTANPQTIVPGRVITETPAR